MIKEPTRPIQMVDTRSQYHKIKPDIDKAVLAVMESTAFINGQPVRGFSKHLSEYMDVKHVVPCANGSDALQIAMMALDLKPGDEVITPSFTFIATIEVIALLKLVPVFVDVDERTFCMDPDAVLRAITPATKAIVPVHLFGQTAPMEALMKIAEKYKLFVIEDNAQSIGSDYYFSDGTRKKAGTIGHIGTTSFYPSKNLGAFGDGGAIFTNDTSLAQKLKMISNHGQSSRYYHDIVGCNSRLDTLQAAILDIKLKHLDEYIAARIKAAEYYDKAFSGAKKLKLPERASYSRHVFHQYTLVLDGVDRDKLHQYLAGQGIPSAVYYPVPGHRQKMFEGGKYADVNLPVTDHLSQNVISLPMHTELDTDQLEYITTKILEYTNN